MRRELNRSGTIAPLPFDGCPEPRPAPGLRWRWAGGGALFISGFLIGLAVSQGVDRTPRPQSTVSSGTVPVAIVTVERSAGPTPLSESRSESIPASNPAPIPAGQHHFAFAEQVATVTPKSDPPPAAAPIPFGTGPTADLLAADPLFYLEEHFPPVPAGAAPAVPAQPPIPTPTPSPAPTAAQPRSPAGASALSSSSPSSIPVPATISSRAAWTRTATFTAPPVPERPPAPEPAAVIAPADPEWVSPDDPAAPWRRNAVPVAWRGDRPAVAIVIDDLGLDRRRTQRAIDLPGPLTLAFLPYATALPEQTGLARRAGHELLVHLPMEPISPAFDPGPGVLRTGVSTAENLNRLVRALATFDGYVGINNHMGSRLTADRNALMPVLTVLHRRGLLFLDSRTSEASVGADLAAQLGLPGTTRDVFLDDDPQPQAVRAALQRTATIARRQGLAVAIGHPYDSTLALLAEWLADAPRHGLVLVPISAAVRRGRTGADPGPVPASGPAAEAGPGPVPTAAGALPPVRPFRLPFRPP